MNLQCGDEILYGVLQRWVDGTEVLVPLRATVFRTDSAAVLIRLEDLSMKWIPRSEAERCREAYLERKPMDSKPECGVLYQHYKGSYYLPVMLAGLSEDHATPMVVYRSCSTGRIWVRPLNEWQEDVLWPNGVMAPRYKRT